ncbi:similar to P-type ATPase [Botrytis cinerea T4]|uniref:Similar to P-type ATPase n=1 Tax=Botryotinia fuckeliana (strain T4) TaxID=999810 RepID=G2YVF2_BOTF4|nr:similar to P-type ATPase [Botrytis cinerea T4]
MAGDIGTRSTSPSSCDELTSSDDSNAPPATMDPAPLATNKENHRVRFSVDVERDRDRGGFVESFSQRPTPPNLSIDTRAAGTETAADGRATTLGQGRRVLGISPISPRTRDRGYSLRRTLFARGLNNSEPEPDNIELVEAEPSQNGGKKTQTSVAVCPVHDEIEETPSVSTQPTSSSRTSKYKDKKAFGTRDLPNYDRFVRKVKGDDSIIRRAKKKSQWLWREKILKDILRQREIPPSKDGRHLSKEMLLVRAFSKLANAYFLLVSILQMVPGLSPTGSYTTIAPLLVFVMISMAKEGYDDVRRYKLDQVENNNQTLVLNAYTPLDINEKSHIGSKGPRSKRVKKGLGIDSPETVHEIDIEATASGPRHWATLKWKNLKVGDIIKLERDEAVPADILLLHADGPNNIAFIETMALDGETNLKTKSPPVPLVKKCSTVEKLVDCRAHVVIEDPNLDLYNFDGRVTIDGETLPLTTNEISAKSE